MPGVLLMRQKATPPETSSANWWRKANRRDCSGALAFEGRAEGGKRYLLPF